MPVSGTQVVAGIQCQRELGYLCTSAVASVCLPGEPDAVDRWRGVRGICLAEDSLIWFAHAAPFPQGECCYPPQRSSGSLLALPCPGT